MPPSPRRPSEMGRGLVPDTPATHSSPARPCSVQAPRPRSLAPVCAADFNFYLAAGLLAQRVGRKDLAPSLEEVCARLGLRSLKFQFLVCFRAAEKISGFSSERVRPGGGRFGQCFAPSDEAPLLVFREGLDSCYCQKWSGLSLQWLSFLFLNIYTYI